MSNIPIPRLIEMIHDPKHPLIIDSMLKEHYMREHLNVREGARKVILRVLICGAIKTNKTEIYLP
jgi:hypothetical protein